MRTTLDIDQPVLDQLKLLQKKEKRTLSQLASSLLAEALASHRMVNQGLDKPIFQWESSDMGARIDIGDKETLYRALDGR